MTTDDIGTALEQSLAVVRERDGLLPPTDSERAAKQQAIREKWDREADERAATAEERRAMQVERFGLEGVEVGSMVWSKARMASNDTAAHGGMVVGVGIDERDEQYLLVLDEREAKVMVQVKKKDGRSWLGLRPAALRRMYLDDVDLASVEPPYPSRMAGWARKGLLAAAVGSTAARGGDITEADRELIALSLGLVDTKEDKP